MFLPINHTIAAGTDSTTIQSAGINSAGADLAVVIGTYLKNPNEPLVSDDSASVWHDLIPSPSSVSTNATIRISYAALAGTGPSHKFQAQGVNCYPAIAVLLFSGWDGNVPDQQNKFQADGTPGSSPSVQAGPITPLFDNELVIFGAMGDTPGATGGSVPAPYILRDETDYTGFVVFTGSAYTIQTTATPTNPPWTYGTSQGVVGAAIASFKAAAAVSLLSWLPRHTALQGDKGAQQFNSGFIPPMKVN